MNALIGLLVLFVVLGLVQRRAGDATTPIMFAAILLYIAYVYYSG